MGNGSEKPGIEMRTESRLRTGSVKSKAWLHNDDANPKLKVKQQQIQKSEAQVHSNLIAHLQCAYTEQIQHKHG